MTPEPEPVREPDIPTGERIGDIREFRASFAGMVGLVCLPFLVFGTHGSYGWAATLGLCALTVFLFSLGIAWFMHFPRRVSWLPVIGFLAWLGAVLAARS